MARRRDARVWRVPKIFVITAKHGWLAWIDGIKMLCGQGRCVSGGADVVQNRRQALRWAIIGAPKQSVILGIISKEDTCGIYSSCSFSLEDIFIWRLKRHGQERRWVEQGILLGNHLVWRLADQCLLALISALSYSRRRIETVLSCFKPSKDQGLPIKLDSKYTQSWAAWWNAILISIIISWLSLYLARILYTNTKFLKIPCMQLSSKNITALHLLRSSQVCRSYSGLKLSSMNRKRSPEIGQGIITPRGDMRAPQ